LRVNRDGGQERRARGVTWQAKMSNAERQSKTLASERATVRVDKQSQAKGNARQARKAAARGHARQH
jgi:hypothetical protein